MAKRMMFHKDRRKKHLISFGVYFLLTILVVTTVVPVMARVTESETVAQNEVVGQSPQSPTGTTLLQQGRQLYQAGKFFEAANVWQKAAKSYQASGEIPNEVQALNYLSLAYQDLGQWESAGKAIATSLNLLTKLEQKSTSEVALLAQALNSQGSLQLAQGDAQAALETWKQAEAAYQRAGNETGSLGSKINIAQALQAQGQYRRAKSILEKLVVQLQGQPDNQLKADGLRSLGVALQTVGDLLQSKAILEQSWAISQKINAQADTTVTLFSIGNVARDLGQDDVAFAYYQESARLAQNPLDKLQAQLNQLSLLVKNKQENEARDLAAQINSDLTNLAPSRALIYAKINLAESLMKLEGGKSPVKVSTLLATAVQFAKQLRDARGEAYALNQLSKVYAEERRWGEARQLAEQSLEIAQGIDAADIVARSAWQLARILKEEGNIDGSLAAYRTAYSTLQDLRSDLVAINPEVQFNFKESVEPIYREFVSLLLKPNNQGQLPQENLQQAREAMEALQLAELDNFFKDACLDVQPVGIDTIDPEAAVIYPIILPDRLEVVLSLPNGTLFNYSTNQADYEIETVLQELFSSLYPGYSSAERLKLSEKVYNWLIRPAEAQLANNGIETLVFVPDGLLRNLPMAALYDGNEYLVQKYKIALSPGLQLFPQGLSRERLSALAVGLAEARQGFNALPGVKIELKDIASEIDSEVLLDKKFTLTSFQKQIDSQSFPVVHLATHGQFSSNPEETFLLTWDGRIDFKDFDLLFQKRRVGILEPIELLVLSACQTASGDKRATLGLAGLALGSGARSTVASLWSVNDESTADLMSEFYRQLAQPGRQIAKAEALRQSQLKLLANPKYNHPYFWASFVLIGNWL